jgi:hypothetical protein
MPSSLNLVEVAMLEGVGRLPPKKTWSFSQHGSFNTGNMLNQ